MENDLHISKEEMKRHAEIVKKTLAESIKEVAKKTLAESDSKKNKK